MITAMEFAQRRQQLLSTLGKGTLAILPSARSHIRNQDAEYPFRQNSDFYYYTGLNEPDCVAVFKAGSSDGEFILFLRDNDAKLEQWTGPRVGVRGAKQNLQADSAFAIEDFTKTLPSLMADCKKVFYPFNTDEKFMTQLHTALKTVQRKIRSGQYGPVELADLSQLTSEQRLIKSPAEINLMQKAVDISIKAHQAARSACQPGVYEYEIEAKLLHEFCRQGARFPAYESIVAGGENACVLHYTANNAQLKDQDLLLIDAGAEFQYYAADITRTFPINGRFNHEQRALYNLVLQAQLAAIEQVRPGNSWYSMQKVIIEILTHGLVDLGLLQGKPADLIESKAYQQFYMHNSGHWLGMDVHDVGAYQVDQQWRDLEPGMVLTIEPGLYIAPHAEVASKWQSIGIRIEDDVLVTETGYHILSAALPKQVDELEK